MGQIRSDFGSISIESRSESFIIHPGYGWRSLRKPIGDVQPGEHFMLVAEPGRLYYCNGITVDSVEVIERGVVDGVEVSRNGSFPRNGDEQVIPCDSDGNPLDQEEDPDSGTFGKHWREDGHPEFLRQDLPHLIAALEDLRDND